MLRAKSDQEGLAVAGLPGLPLPGWATAFPHGFRRCFDFGMAQVSVWGASLSGALLDAPPPLKYFSAFCPPHRLSFASNTAPRGEGRR